MQAPDRGADDDLANARGAREYQISCDQESNSQQQQQPTVHSIREAAQRIGRGRVNQVQRHQDARHQREREAGLSRRQQEECFAKAGQRQHCRDPDQPPVSGLQPCEFGAADRKALWHLRYGGGWLPDRIDHQHDRK